MEGLVALDIQGRSVLFSCWNICLGNDGSAILSRLSPYPGDAMPHFEEDTEQSYHTLQNTFVSEFMQYKFSRQQPWILQMVLRLRRRTCKHAGRGTAVSADRMPKARGVTQATKASACLSMQVSGEMVLVRLKAFGIGVWGVGLRIQGSGLVV